MFFNFSRTLWSIFSKTYSHVGKYWNSILKFGTGWWCRGTMIEYSNSAAIFFHCNFPWLLVVIQEVLFFLPLDSPGHFPSNFPFILSSSCCVHTFFHKFCVPTWNTSDPQTCNYIFLINKNNTPIHGSWNLQLVVVVVFVTQNFPLGAPLPNKNPRGDILLPKGVISEALGMGSFGVVWAAHGESQVSGKGMVIFPQGKHFSPQKTNHPEKELLLGGGLLFCWSFFLVWKSEDPWPPGFTFHGYDAVQFPPSAAFGWHHFDIGAFLFWEVL